MGLPRDFRLNVLSQNLPRYPTRGIAGFCGIPWHLAGNYGSHSGTPWAPVVAPVVARANLWDIPWNPTENTQLCVALPHTRPVGCPFFPLSLTSFNSDDYLFFPADLPEFASRQSNQNLRLRVGDTPIGWHLCLLIVAPPLRSSPGCL